MKVTVCFGPVRVIVPCGDGEILVKDLIRQAVHRYKKATGKGSENWVAVHSLQTQRDGGILDPDDRLHDVADDREQIIANFGEGEGAHHGGGDGASGSSVGTSSPDIFQAAENFQTDIEVTNEQIASGVPGPLQVRRGSEPALNQLLPSNGVDLTNGHCIGIPVTLPNNNASKRWSAAPLITEPRDRPPGRKDDRVLSQMNGYEDKWRTHVEEEEPVTLRPPPAFARDGSNRLSIQFFGDNGYRWCDAAEKAMHNRLQSLSLPREHKRREPLGQAHNSPVPESPSEISHSDGTDYIVLDTGGGSLGLHVVPDYDALGRERGLLVQGVEPGGRVDADGRLNVNDRIVEINGNNLLHQPFNVVQEIFRDSLRSQELRLRVVKGNRPPQTPATPKKNPPPPTYPKPSLTQERAEPVTMVEGEERLIMGNKMATTRKLPAAGASLQTGNTRKLGKKVEISLVKGQFGLGFSVTTRDNPAGGNAPIYIKNILPKGAAVEDGRLRPGDRLLAVDGIDLNGKTQADVVALLRNVPPGAAVNLLVSRHVDGMTCSPNTSMSLDGTTTPPETVGSTPSPNVRTPDRPLPVNQSNNKMNSSTDSHDENSVYPWRQREIITLDVPVHDSEKAGLGVSVKGKTSSPNNSNGNSSVVNGTNGTNALDLGIFIKNVIHGGAAARDGRLKTNDQLLNVNGISLLGQSNASAMETLRRALLRTDGPVVGHITITIARKLAHRSDSISSLLTDSSANTETFGCRTDESPPGENSGNSENSDQTVIFQPYKNHLESLRNPALDRVSGQPSSLPHNINNQLRNESYYRATHQQSILLNGSSGKLISTTINMPPSESVIIEDDDSPYMSNHVQRQDSNDNKSSQPQQRNSTSSSQTNDITYASQLSLDDGGGFSRDAFGRQSMSEKRHAALDAKSTDTYQRNKKAREEREKAKKEGNNNDTKVQLGPSLGMKKSSSLESLQTMVQEMQMCENEDGSFRSQTGARIVRGRGCNESFRAAVDRLDPLAEDDGESPLGRQPSLNTSLDSKSSKGKKKAGLLKGIGSMFRFGKHRKEVGAPASNGPVTHRNSVPNAEDEREAARKAAREEQQRIQEQYRRLMQKQNEYQQQQQHLQQQIHHQQPHPLNKEHGLKDAHSNHRDSRESDLTIVREEGGEKYTRLDEPSRTERINQLRAEHQRRHQERRGLYPLDDAEERYEHHLKQRLENGDLDSAVTMNRPGSRVGITDPSRFSHYVNYHEIQQHLKEEIAAVKLRRPKNSTSSLNPSDESRRQQHYHSQRQASRDPIHRPVSNFYEYESVQAVLRAQAMMDSGSLPRRDGSQTVHMNGGNHIPSQHRYSQINYPQVYPPYGRSYGKQAGPFVTHVTIRETQPKKIGGS